MREHPIHIAGGRALVGGALREASLLLADGAIAGIDRAAPAGAIGLDAAGLLVLPGIVDIHGDAFERQIMPRPKVHFPLPVALADTDRQLVANGITTAFHGLTLGWEPGLRSLAAGVAFAAALEEARPRLAAEARLHIRWEVHALDARAAVEALLRSATPPVLAFNDHTPGAYHQSTDATKLNTWAERSGLSMAGYRALMEEVWSRRADVPAAVEGVAAAAQAAGVRMLSHDDDSPATRRRYRALGARIAEFPLTRETAAEARAAGEAVVLGAPNALRGKSHINALSAAEAVAEGLCTILASDYYYPAPLLAAFRLAEQHGMDAAWNLVSAYPARAAGLDDRGRLAPGARADVILVRPANGGHPPQVVATIAGGRLAFLAEARLG